MERLQFVKPEVARQAFALNGLFGGFKVASTSTQNQEERVDCKFELFNTETQRLYFLQLSVGILTNIPGSKNMGCLSFCINKNDKMLCQGIVNFDLGLGKESLERVVYFIYDFLPKLDEEAIQNILMEVGAKLEQPKEYIGPVVI